VQGPDFWPTPYTYIYTSSRLLRGLPNVCFAQLTRWSTVLLKKLTVASQGKKLSTFHGPRMCITVFTRACRCMVSLDFHIYVSYFFKNRLILSPRLSLGLTSGFFPLGFIIEILCRFHIARVHAACTAEIIILDLIIVIASIADHSGRTV
jgi:hypothetical protein